MIDTETRFEKIVEEQLESNRVNGASCMCKDIKCICVCIYGGLNSGELGKRPSVCERRLCVSHGIGCIII